MAVDPQSNRLSGVSYDANGNYGSGGIYSYDVSNRMVSATLASANTERYGYAPDNKRIYRLPPSAAYTASPEFTFYGARGEKLGVYAVNNVFQPTGGEVTSTANDRQKFGTYNRDGFSGLDYADQRYYASANGRFNTADPFDRSAGPAVPGTWNRVAYVAGDPANANDPQGLCTVGGTTYPDGSPSCPNITSVTVCASPNPVAYEWTIIDYEGCAWGKCQTVIPGKVDVIGAREQHLIAREEFLAYQEETDQLLDKLETAGECLMKSAADHYGLTDVAGIVELLGAPIPKSYLPPYRLIGNPNTTLLSSLGNFLKIEIPRIAGTTNLLRLAGRVAGPVGAALFALDVAAITIDTWKCYESRTTPQ